MSKNENEQRVALIKAGFEKRLSRYNLKEMEQDGTLKKVPKVYKRLQEAKKILKKLNIKNYDGTYYPGTLSSSVNRMSVDTSNIYKAIGLNVSQIHRKMGADKGNKFLRNEVKKHFKKHNIKYKASWFIYTIYW